MAKKAAKKLLKKKTVKKKKRSAKTGSAKKQSRRANWKMSLQPVGTTLSINEALAFPRYACLKTGVSGACILYEFNNKNGQYDILIGPTDCSHCSHFIEPVG